VKRSIALVLVASIASGSISQATLAPVQPTTFSELVRNTKETDSILETWRDSDAFEEEHPEGAEKIQGSVTFAFAAFAASMEEKDSRVEACEPLVLSRLQKEMGKLGLPTDPSAIRYALSVLREKNLIDDVTLLPLLAAQSAWEMLGYNEKEWVKKDPEGRTAKLLCPTEQILTVVASVQAEKGRKMRRRHIEDRIEKMEKERNTEGVLRFLPTQIAWLKTLVETRFHDETPFTLPEVLSRVEAVKNSSSRAIPNDIPTKIMSKKKKKTGGLSNRLALYAKYNGLQINILAETYQKFTDRMGATSAELRIKYSDGREDEVYQLSPQEQYRMAAKMLHKELEELKLSGLFSGKSPTFDEMIIATVETGLVHAKEVDAVLAVDDLWNPNIPAWQKTWNIAKKVGNVGKMFIPPPGNTIASLVISLVEIFTKKKAADKLASGDDRGISIF